MGNCVRNQQHATREEIVNKQKYNKNVHKKFGWRGGILVEKSEKGVEGHFQTAFTLDKDEKYEQVEKNEPNPIPRVLDLVAEIQEEEIRFQDSLKI